MYKLEPYNRGASDDEMIADLRLKAEAANGRRLSSDLYKNLGGRFGATTIVRRFSSWNSALQRAGLPVRMRETKATRADILDDMRHVAKIRNRVDLPITDYIKHGRFTERAIRHRLRSWSWPDALKAAGLTSPLAFHPRVSDEDYFADIEAVWRKVGRQPSYGDMQEHGTYSSNAFHNRFGGWRKALEAFVKAMSTEAPVPATQGTTDTEAPVVTPHLNIESRRRTQRAAGWRLRHLVQRRDKFRCVLCGKSPATHHGTALVIDHIVPWSKGGETEFENLRTLCEPCNGGRGDLD